MLSAERFSKFSPYTLLLVIVEVIKGDKGPVEVMKGDKGLNDEAIRDKIETDTSCLFYCRTMFSGD